MASARQKSSPVLFLRVTFPNGSTLGPGKARLMELIAEHGSISAAGKSLGMSYKRAWSLVESLNLTFAGPVVAVQHGGAKGGGAALTDLGRAVVSRFRDIETCAEKGARPGVAALALLLAPAPGSDAAGTPRPKRKKRTRRGGVAKV